MLGHRLRRWPNIETTLGEYLVFVEQAENGLVFFLNSWWNEPTMDVMAQQQVSTNDSIKQ